LRIVLEGKKRDPPVHVSVNAEVYSSKGKDAKFNAAENSTFPIELEYNFLFKGYSHPASVLAKSQ
jgi:hypothetical protein